MKTSQHRTRMSEVIERYVSLKRALGRAFRNETNVLESFDHFVAQQGRELTPRIFAAWCQTQQHLTLTVRRNRMRVVRNLCLYRRRTEPGCFVPDKALFPRNHQPVVPYVFTEDEVCRLLAEAELLQPTRPSPLRPQNLRLAVVLLFTTGIRRGELVRLTLGDYDDEEKSLLIRETKFHKSRLVPLSISAVAELNDFLDKRGTAGAPETPNSPLLWNRYDGGKGYTGAGLAEGLRNLFRQAEIRKPDGRLPRIHDLRHAFAANALLRWYRAGVDIGAKLPHLATYMGHVSIESTQYYVQFADELAVQAGDRFEKHCSTVVKSSKLDERQNQ